MNKFSTVWVFSDTPCRLPELIGGARLLGESVSVFTTNPEQSSTAFQLGATQVYQLNGKPNDRITEDYAATIVTAIKQQNDHGLILLPNTRRGKLFAVRLGFHLNAAISNDAISVAINADAVSVKHLVYGGLALGDETLNTPFIVTTVSVGTFEPVQPNSSASGSANIINWIAPEKAVICHAVQPKACNSVDVDKARLVVGVGRGIGSKENITMASALADAIGAELACSRPVAENEKWMDHERYLGISNLRIKPELYLAVGISGQIQHMVGVNSAQTIVAINKDKNAPIFQCADFGVVGDLFKILPALTHQLKN